MRVLERLTMENLRKNKRRTIVTIAGVTLASALILAVAGMVTSFQQMMVNWAKTNTGDYHDMYENVPAEDIKFIENHVETEEVFYSKPVEAKTIGEDTYETYQSSYLHAPYDQEWYEKLEQIEPKAGEKYNVFVRYKTPKDYAKIEENLLATLMDESGLDINVRTNSELLRYEAMVMADAALSALYSLAAIVIGIIVVTSIFVIRNSFSISATERAKQFGMLASIGATPRQIRQSVLFEGLVIAAIGIPTGIVLGVAATAILTGVVNLLLDGIIVDDSKVAFSMPFWVFIVAIVLSLVTVLLASLRPAIRAGKMSPIEAIRGSQDLKIKAKKIRSPKIVQQLFGIGGVIAHKNLKRSRKKYRTTVASIVLSVATFVGLASFMGYSFKAADLQFGGADFDFSIIGAPRAMGDEVIKRFDLKNYVYYWPASTADATVLFMDQTNFEQYAKSVGVNAKDYNKVAIMSDYALTAREEGGYERRRVYETQEGESYTSHIITKAEKDGSYREEDVETVEIPITKVSETAPLAFGSGQTPAIFVSENYYLRDKLYPSELASLFMHDTPNLNEVSDYAKQLREQHAEFEDANIENVEEIMAQQQRLYLLIAIFLYGFVIVVMLIGVTNIFNTITTNIALRSKEFAMLKSVGMTSKEFNRMVRLESLMYSGKALLIGLPLGLLMSYGFYRAFAEAADFGFIVPWNAMLIAVLAVALLIWAIMDYSVRQVEKQNIIETIRDENI